MLLLFIGQNIFRNIIFKEKSQENQENQENKMTLNETPEVGSPF